MKRMWSLIGIIFGIFIIACAILSVYFTIILISSRDEVTEQYENMEQPESMSHGGLKYNIIEKYYSVTKDDDIFIKFGVGSTTKDSIVNKYVEDEDKLPSETVVDDRPECTCIGDDPCEEGNCQDCEACKQNVLWCKLRHNGYSDKNSGEAWEILRNISLSKSFNGYTTWSQGSPPIYSTSGQTGCCFYVAMLGLCNAYGAGANVADVFAAAGAGNHGGLSVQSDGNVKLDIPVGGSLKKAQEIINNLGVGISLSDASKSDIPDGGTYLVYVTHDSDGIYASKSEQTHWFVVSNNTVVTPAQGMYGQQFDPNVSCSFDHIYKVN